MRFADMTLTQAARTTPVVEMTDTLEMIDLAKMRAYRLNRLRDEMKRQDVGGCVLTSVFSIRYATGMRDAGIMQSHIPLSYLFVPAEGPTVYFDGETGKQIAQGLETIDELGDEAIQISYMFAGQRMDEMIDRWVNQIAALMQRHGGGSKRLGVESPVPQVAALFANKGLEVVHAHKVIEPARAIKSVEEILCMNYAIAVAEDGMWRMREELRPGMTEIELWSHLWKANVEAGGDWIEGRLLAAGDRTNPWLQEASGRIIRPGELVAFDTDMVGPFGYSADVSRTYYCGSGRPTDYQRELYGRAYEEIQHNLELMKPGISFREVTEKGFRQPEQFRDQHYAVMAHGVGMSDEWPCIYYPQDEALIYDGELQPGMAMCVESYVGEIGGAEGVKLEEQVLITEDGCELLSKFPFEDNLLGHEV
ncbi:Xaa-Pro peptidase family protein (plasmid) [Aliisedimentitalea scapharcae]|uniref:Xaa-Pro peptidase family protein n=1 Tax=Aliisedimentitalea scapharcae TaxID=1524259 RepID=A0ABZ2XYZ9_9RHOB